MSYVLHFLMVYCFVQAIFGRQLKRLATWIVDRPEPREYCKPVKYVEGSWRQ